MRLRRNCAAAMFALVTLAATAPSQPVPTNLWDGLRWRLVGPFRGGRAEAAAGVPGDPQTYYFGAVAGGLWKTTNGGVTWTPITDSLRAFSVGAITVDPSNPNTLYLGTGEPCLRNDISYGDGVYKSTDAGQTWIHLGLADSRHIAAILVDPQHPNIVLVAAVGHAFGPNEERGVFRSRDGGKTWQKVLYVDANTGATDLVFDPNHSKVLFAAMYEVRRSAYTMKSGGPGSSLYKSSDGGATWKRVEGRGLPGGILGRIGIAVSAADSKRVYAMIEAEQNALYRSDDGGNSWQMVNNEPIWVRPWYGNHVYADPKNADTVYVLDLGAMRSTDGGRHFQAMPVPHSDTHHLWIDPTNPRRMIEADDGGVSITIDGGATWTAENNQPTGQFYHVATDNDFNYRIYASQQDSGTVAILSRGEGGGITERDWHAVAGGESGYNWPDPRDSQLVYGGDHNGHFTLYDGHTGQARNIAPWFGARAHVPAELKHRFQWTAPMQISPHDPNVLYIGGEVLFKTMDRGMSWTVISPDLTRNDKSKQGSSPEPLTPDNSSSEYYDTIFAVAESPVTSGLIWAGTDDGLVHVTRDAGRNWVKVTPSGLPEWTRVNMIEPSPFDAAAAYLAADLHFSDDLRPIIFRTRDLGKTWTPITGGIAENDYVHSIHADPVRKGMLYAGTENGMYVSFDDGEHWHSLKLNLPYTPVHDMAIHGDDLVVATHGRGLWVLDNITPLRQAAARPASEPAHLYQPAIAYRGPGFFGGGGQRNAGQNPPSGAVIDYYLSSAPASPITLEVLDARGQVVHRSTSAKPAAPEAAARSDTGLFGDAPAATSLPARAGMNRYVWNQRTAGPAAVPGIAVIESMAGGPMVPPGEYRAKLGAFGKEYTAPLVICADPRIKATQADLEKQYQFAVKARDRVSELHAAANEIRSARAALEAARRGAGASKLQAVDSAERAMAAIEGELIQVKSTSREAALVYPIMLDGQYADLGNVAESADGPPAAQVLEVFEDYEKRREELLARWKELQAEVAALAGAAGGPKTE